MNYLKITLSITMLLIFNHAFSQQDRPKHEVKLIFSDALPITLGHGMAYGFSDAIKNAFSDYNRDDKKDSGGGMYGIGYRYSISPRLSVGADIGYMQINTKLAFSKKDDASVVKKFDRKAGYTVILPTAQLNYFERPLVSLYGSASAGLFLTNSTEKGDGDTFKDKSTNFGFQVNPIAVRVGRKFAGFAELGFGMKGFVNLGFSTRF